MLGKVTEINLPSVKPCKVCNKLQRKASHQTAVYEGRTLREKYTIPEDLKEKKLLNKTHPLFSA